ncbi:hypothetical protein LDENG_00161810 [Lucifuga dentata]|nr:hypothetical protein LDENG_00161810 [Lucifuga dentata]
MAAATASVADVSRTDIRGEDDSRDRNNSGPPQSQCTPMPLPALGTQMIIKGNGTNVGTVISLQCPAKHKQIGGELRCIMGTNSTQWVGETHCKLLSPYEDFGFRVALLASIVSSAIILLMSMAFITCCLLDCINGKKRKRQGRETDLWQWEEQIEQQEDNRSHYSHKGRNNNNNTQEKLLSAWDDHDPARCNNKRACRCYHHFPCGLTSPPSGCSYVPAPPLAPLPGCDYDLPHLPQNSESEQNSGLPQHLGPIQSSSQTKSSGLIQISAVRPSAELLWQYREHENIFSGLNESITDESTLRNINSAKEWSIQIVSV